MALLLRTCSNGRYFTQKIGLRYLTYAEKHAEPIKTALHGAELLNNPQLNKGAAFPEEERKAFGLAALLPSEVHGIAIQEKRAYQQFLRGHTKLAQYNFLVSLREQNRVLFFRLLQKHLKEMLPVIYTPTVGEAIQRYSEDFRRSSGLFISYPNRDTMHDQIEALGSKDDIDLIVVTDSEGILGLGDLGCGGILICVGKSTLYTLGGGIDPSRILCVALDPGTNNQELLNNELYLGWRRPRLSGKEYDEFVNQFIKLASERFPSALIHLEDFGVANASRLLEQWQDKACIFNDDIQATGAVAVSSMLAGCRVTRSLLTDQRVVVHGAGSAGCGIAAAIASTMVELGGISIEEARSKIYLIDRFGLINDTMTNLRNTQQPFARTSQEISGWAGQGTEKGISLLETVKRIQPTVLVGTSGQSRAFTEEIIKEMAKGVDRPIVMPLSNPTSLCEADPADVNVWTNGKALIATGSPYPPCKIPGTDKMYEIAESNNALIFPGLGLGTVLSKAKHLTNGMIAAGINALSKRSPAISDPDKALLPDIATMRDVSHDVAAAVMKAAKKEGLNRVDFEDKDIAVIIRQNTWDAVYRPLERV